MSETKENMRAVLHWNKPQCVEWLTNAGVPYDDYLLTSDARTAVLVAMLECQQDTTTDSRESYVIKPLVWEQWSGTTWFGRAHGLGDYVVDEQGVYSGGGGVPINRLQAKSFDEAKQACEKHYRERLTPALVKCVVENPGTTTPSTYAVGDVVMHAVYGIHGRVWSIDRNGPSNPVIEWSNGYRNMVPPEHLIRVGDAPAK